MKFKTTQKSNTNLADDILAKTDITIKICDKDTRTLL